MFWVWVTTDGILAAPCLHTCFTCLFPSLFTPISQPWAPTPQHTGARRESWFWTQTSREPCRCRVGSWGLRQGGHQAGRALATPVPPLRESLLGMDMTARG